MEEFLSENLYWFDIKPSKSPVFGPKIGPKRCFSDILIQKLPQTNENHISISLVWGSLWIYWRVKNIGARQKYWSVRRVNNFGASKILARRARIGA